MNVCMFVGRVANDPELKEMSDGNAKCDFRIAVQRDYKDQSGNRPADFIQCVSWRQKAEFIHKFIHKGDMIAVKGSLQNRSYQAQDGTPRYVSEIIVDKIKPCGNAQGKTENAPGGFMPVDDADLPF